MAPAEADAVQAPAGRAPGVYGLSFDNPWIRSVDSAGRAAPGWLAALLAAALSVGFVWGGQVVARAVMPRLAAVMVQSAHRTSEPFGALLASLAVPYILVFGPFLIAAVLLRRLWEVRAAPQGWSGARALALGLPVGLLGYLAVVGLLAATRALGHGAGHPVGPAAVAGVMAMLALVAFQAGAEELFFRGWLQPVLCARWGAWAGLLATSVLFALGHLIGFRWGVLAVINLTLGGLLFGLLALRTGGLWGPFAAHLAWNWSESAVAGLDPNPGLGPLGSVLDLEATGPRLLTGGAEGVSAGLAYTAPLVVLILVFTLLKGRETAPAVKS